ncbi:hypothetical protein MTO96_003201 [Rhipicephalus appendiculatus]
MLASFPRLVVNGMPSPPITSRRKRKTCNTTRDDESATSRDVDADTPSCKRRERAEKEYGPRKPAEKASSASLPRSPLAFELFYFFATKEARSLIRAPSPQSHRCLTHRSRRTQPSHFVAPKKAGGTRYTVAKSLKDANDPHGFSEDGRIMRSQRNSFSE